MGLYKKFWYVLHHQAMKDNANLFRSGLFRLLKQSTDVYEDRP